MSHTDTMENTYKNYHEALARANRQGLSYHQLGATVAEYLPYDDNLDNEYLTLMNYIIDASMVISNRGTFEDISPYYANGYIVLLEWVIFADAPDDLRGIIFDYLAQFKR